MMQQSRYLQQQQQSGDVGIGSIVVAYDNNNNNNSSTRANSEVVRNDVVSIFSSSSSTSSNTTTTMMSNSTNSSSSSYDEVEEHMKQSLEQTAKAYLNSFPPQPETESAATTFATFSDPNRFSDDSIRETTQYLTNRLRGVVWLDANSDGIRGSSSNRTMNAMEYDVGVGGAKVQLVHCDTDEILVAAESNTSLATAAAAASSFPAVEVLTFPYEGGTAKRTEISAAGIYEFPLLASEDDDDGASLAVPPGRYYVMFTAPRNFRIIGNMLPLDRKQQRRQQQQQQQQTNDDASYYEDAASVICTPFGGEANAYRKKVEKIGDLDWEGYCGRSIGCFDVGKGFELKEKYPLLKLLANDNPQEEKDGYDDDEQGMDMADYVGTFKNVVALPSRNTLNVGLSQDEWPLRTVQFADMQLTLAFPSSVSDEELVYAETFAANNVTRALQKSLLEYFHSKRADNDTKFDIFGVDLHGSRVIDVDAYSAMQEEHTKASSTTTSSYGDNNACLVRNPQKSPEEPPPRQVTYNFTIRAQYDPPPQVKLGPTVLQSFNSDPTDLFERLIEEMSRNDNDSAPPVFQDVEGAVACHMTLEKAPVIVDMDIQCWSILPTMGDPLIECWAILPVILLSMAIASLIMFLLIRRSRRLRLNALNEARKSISAYLHRRKGFMFR